MNKPDSRKVALERRRLRPALERHRQSILITQHLASLPLFHDANVVASYESWASEPDTQAINWQLVERGAELLLPDTNFAHCWRQLEPAAHSTEERGQDQLSEKLFSAEDLYKAELIIVPALAVDWLGTRLGRGSGWYDQMLPHRAPRAVTIALLFADEYQENQLIPREPHDVPIDMVVTPNGFIQM